MGCGRREKIRWLAAHTGKLTRAWIVVVDVSDEVVPPRSTATFGVVNGDLEVGRRSVVKGEGSPPKVDVRGTVYVEGSSRFECSLSAENLDGEDDVTVEGDLEVRNRVNIDDGHLDVSGKMNARRVDVGRSLTIRKDFEGDEVDVGGRLLVGGTTKARKIDVGGAFRGKGEVKAESVDVGGSVEIESSVDIEDIDVGGKVEVNGGRIGKVDVGGSFASRGSLKFDKINVGGTVKLSGECNGGDINVGGSCKCSCTRLKFGDIDVGGFISIAGSAEGADLDVGGKVVVDGDLMLSENLDVGGVADIDGELTAREIDVGGRLRARRAKADARVSVGGSIETVRGVYASYVEIGRRGKVRGLIKGDEVLIGKGARVEDVYAKTVTLEREAMAQNLYAERIKLESRCHIYGEAQYTEELDEEHRVTFERSPQKVDKLPLPP